MNKDDYKNLIEKEIENTKKKQLEILQEIFKCCDELKNDIYNLNRDIDEWYCDCDKYNLVENAKEFEILLEKRSRLYNELEKLG